MIMACVWRWKLKHKQAQLMMIQCIQFWWLCENSWRREICSATEHLANQYHECKSCVIYIYILRDIDRHRGVDKYLNDGDPKKIRYSVPAAPSANPRMTEARYTPVLRAGLFSIDINIIMFNILLMGTFHLLLLYYSTTLAYIFVDFIRSIHHSVLSNRIPL